MWKRKGVNKFGQKFFANSIMRKGVSVPLSLETCNYFPSRENNRFYDDTPESGRLKTINIKPWKPITYRNCILSNECVLIDITVAIIIAVSTSLIVKLAPSPIILKYLNI